MLMMALRMNASKVLGEKFSNRIFIRLYDDSRFAKQTQTLQLYLFFLGQQIRSESINLLI